MAVTLAHSHVSPAEPLRRRSVASAAPHVACVGIASLVCAPLAARGWLLLLDSVPGPAGIGAWEPPTGPVYYGLAYSTWQIAGAAVGWVPLAASVAVAAYGAAYLVGGPARCRVVTAVAYGANPFVWDRAYTGQFQVLAGYAVLPWFVAALLRVRDGDRRGLARAGLLWAVAAAMTLHLFWVGAAIVLPWAALRARRWGAQPALARAAAMSAAVAVTTAAWAWPARARAFSPGDTGALVSFATRPADELGMSLGVLAQRGFWRLPERSPPDLAGLLPWAGLAAAAVAVVALAAHRQRADGMQAVIATGGLIGWLAALGESGPLGPIYSACYRFVPGFASMREPGKFTMLVSLAVAVGLGLFAEASAEGHLGATAPVTIAALLAVALALPLAWGLGGRVRPVAAPAGWDLAAETVRSGSGRTLVLPWGLYVRTSAASGRWIRNPAQTWIHEGAVASRDPQMRDVPADDGENARIGEIVVEEQQRAAVGAPPRLGARLAEEGFEWVVVMDAPGVGGGAGTIGDPTLRVVIDAPAITLLHVDAYEAAGISPAQRGEDR